MILLWGAHRSPPHLDFCVSWHQKPMVWCRYLQVCPVNQGVPSVQSEQFSYSRASHAPCLLISTWKWLATKNTRGCILSRQHVLAFIGLVDFFLLDNPGYLPAVLVCGHKLDHGGFPVASKIGDVNPSFTTDCCSMISSCKVSAQVQLRTLHKCYEKQNQNQPSQRAPMMWSSKVVARLVATSHEGREISKITRTSMNFVMNQNWTSCS